MCLLFFSFANVGYAMQPPPPPLDIAKFKTLIAEADIIVVATIDDVNETKSIIETTVQIEKLLKGEVARRTIKIREIYKDPASEKFSAKSKGNGGSDKVITRTIAGPSPYRGKYKNGSRVIILMEKIEGTDEYKPLGSGTYNKHLCEFLIENDGIHTLYFQLAEDVKRYAVSENQFVGLINKLVSIDSSKQEELWLENGKDYLVFFASVF